MTILIGLEDLKLTLKLGVDPHERLQMQDVFVDVQVEADIAKAMSRDALEYSINYQSIADLLERHVSDHKEYHLIETLAHDMMELLFEHFEVDWIWLKVKKPQAVALAKHAYVELERERGEAF